MRRIATFGLALLFLTVAPSANAVGIAIDGNWVTLDETMTAGEWFTGTGVGSATLAGAGSWDFVAAGVTTLDVTDWLVVTDEFEVYDNDVLIASTPSMPDWHTYTGDPFDPAYHTGDPDIAWIRPEFSKIRLFLGAGAHSIKIRDTKIPITAIGAGPFGDGTVAFRVTGGAIPEPATLLLLGGGLAAAAIRRRRR